MPREVPSPAAIRFLVQDFWSSKVPREVFSPAAIRFLVRCLEVSRKVPT